jgi:hypothetical protein
MSDDADFAPPSDIRDPFADDASEADPLAGGGNWEGGPWEGGGGSVHDDQGNTVIMTKEGDVATMTPYGSSVTKADGTTYDNYVDPNTPSTWDPDLGPEGNWEAEKWPGGGGSAHDDQGNTVIFTKEGEVATMTPSGSSATNAQGETFGGQPEDMADPDSDE